MLGCVVCSTVGEAGFGEVNVGRFSGVFGVPLQPSERGEGQNGAGEYQHHGQTEVVSLCRSKRNELLQFLSSLVRYVDCFLCGFALGLKAVTFCNEVGRSKFTYVTGEFRENSVKLSGAFDDFLGIEAGLRGCATRCSTAKSWSLSQEFELIGALSRGAFRVECDHEVGLVGAVCDATVSAPNRGSWTLRQPSIEVAVFSLEESLVQAWYIDMHVQRNPNFWRKPKHCRGESAALGPITGHAVHPHAVHIDGVGVQHLDGANVIETNEVRSTIGRGCALNRSSDEPLGFARCTKLHEEFRKDATSIFRRLDGGVRATCGISDTT